MADFVPIAHSMEIRIRGIASLNAKKLYHVMHAYSTNTSPTLEECQDVADIVSLWVGASYKGQYSDNVTIDEVRVRSNAVEPGPVAYAYPDVVGTQTGDPMPMSTTLVMTLRTGLTGYSQWARFNTFFCDDSKVTDGLYTQAYVDAVQAALQGLMADLLAASLPLAIESRRHLAIYPVTAVQGNRVPRNLSSRYVDRGV